MAKGQQERGTEYVALPKGAVDVLGGDEPVSDEEAAFDEFIAGMSAERMGELRVGKLKLGKDGTPTVNTKGQHCFACPIDQFTYSGLLEHIRHRFGGGLYRVVGIEQGKRGLQFNRLIEIAEELQPAPRTIEGRDNPAGLLESLNRIIADNQTRTEALFARLTENRPPAVDPLDSMAKMAAIMSQLMGNKPQTAGGDFFSELEKFAKIKDLLGSLASGGDSDKESNFYDVVKQGLASFGPALAALAAKNMSQPPALAAPVRPPQPRAPISGQAEPSPSPQPTMSDPAMQAFKKQIDTLVANAKSGVDPKQLAETILDLTPDEKVDDLADMLDDPNMIAKMAALNSEVNIHRPFFEKLRESILSLLDDNGADTLPASDGAVTGSASPLGDAPTS